jgi:hypothetical protein
MKATQNPVMNVEVELGCLDCGDVESGAGMFGYREKSEVYNLFGLALTTRIAELVLSRFLFWFFSFGTFLLLQLIREPVSLLYAYMTSLSQ